MSDPCLAPLRYSSSVQMPMTLNVALGRDKPGEGGAGGTVPGRIPVPNCAGTSQGASSAWSSSQSASLRFQFHVNIFLKILTEIT